MKDFLISGSVIYGVTKIFFRVNQNELLTGIGLH